MAKTTIDTKSLTDIITEFRRITAKDAITPENLGYILQRIADLLATAGTSETSAVLMQWYNALSKAAHYVSNVAQICFWHTAPKPKGNGWRDIGYHFVIYLDGSIHTGRPIEQIGAHCSGHNANSIGICYIGGCTSDGSTPKDTRTPAQKAALVSLIKRLKARYPKATIHGHNEFANKACPSFNVQKDPDLCDL